MKRKNKKEILAKMRILDDKHGRSKPRGTLKWGTLRKLRVVRRFDSRKKAAIFIIFHCNSVDFDGKTGAKYSFSF